ncbi:hypothetical protein [Halomonas sp. 15WGF]|uniref:hypothetical protein n=1 Tax=Halomonas sp. 15WGF TaxID=2570357 RepID=UPI0010BE4FD2|nr:hypothetical protein [Halomonas sp. 15WGF]TKJ09812.1 hypothetical protein E8Q34_14800 [Halomonas sp. 15WGF]
MSRNLPSIDRRIIELLLKPENSTFCVQSLRDQYLELYSVNPVHKAPLRRFIYERIKKLVKAHFVEKDSEIRKRGQLYRVGAALQEADLGNPEDDFAEWLQPALFTRALIERSEGPGWWQCLPGSASSARVAVE